MKVTQKISVGLVFCWLLTATAFAGSMNHIIYIDAGSTGTRIHLYKYEIGSATTTPKVDEIPINSNEVAVTLASFVTEKTKDKVGPQLIKPLLDRAKAKIDELNKLNPQSQVSDVPVYLLGTAGMRLLEDKEGAKNVYDAAKRYTMDNYQGTFITPEFMQPNNTYRNFADLDGGMEALFGWLDVNYLLGNFESKVGTRKLTVGSIDFGGASLEIAVELPAPNGGSSKAFKIGGQQYYVYVQSFSDLGHNEVRKAIEKVPNAETCFPPGYIDKANKITGAFAYEACQSVCNTLLGDKVHDEEIKQIPAGLKGGRIFYGHSGISKTFNAFNVVSDSPQDASAANGYQGTQELLKVKVKKMCGVSLNAMSNSDKKRDAIYFCSLGVFTNYFIKEKMLLKSSQLIVAHTINGKKIEWTLGAVLNGLIQYTPK